MLVPGGIFGRTFSFFSPKAGRQAGKVEPQIAGRRRFCLSNLARGQTIMISNSQTFKAQNSGKTGASPKKRPHPGCLVFLPEPHTATAKESICLRWHHTAGNGSGLNDFSLGHFLCRLGSIKTYAMVTLHITEIYILTWMFLSW